MLSKKFKFIFIPMKIRMIKDIESRKEIKNKIEEK